MPKFHSLKVKQVRQETADCVSVAFEVPRDLEEEYAFTQGQYLTLKTELGGEEVRRSYSICSSPAEHDLRVAIKKVEGGLFSTFANEVLQEGQSLEVMTPMGNFFTQLASSNQKTYVAFAAGSGITPVMSILKTVLSLEPGSRFILFYGNRTTDSIIFREELEGLKNRYLGQLSIHHVLSRELMSSELFSGRIDAEKCKAFCRMLIDVQDVDEFFLCGPGSMIVEIRSTLEELGIDRKKVHVELFTSPDGQKGPVRPVRETIPGFHAEVRIRLDGQLFSFPIASSKDTILDAALKAGADLPFACKGGVCSTCKARLIEGEVDMAVHYALEPEEIREGYILTCQSFPKTEMVRVDFDI